MNENVFRFYTDSKDGVTYNAKVTPLLTKKECKERRWASNFYKNPGFSFDYDGVKWLDTETAFQYHRWIRNNPDEAPEVTSARLEFAECIRSAPTPSKAYFLQSFVKYRKSDGVAYCNAPFPGFQPYAELVMTAYNHGVRRPSFDGDADYQLMRALNEAKYTQNAALMAKLKATGDALIVEHTARDSKWGDGGDGSGTNWLGQVLMHVRSQN
jgi:predicted NAD-dependent protein-ADP-ribosyltransferase YbiA (DUF1768 family)